VFAKVGLGFRVQFLFKFYDKLSLWSNKRTSDQRQEAMHIKAVMCTSQQKERWKIPRKQEAVFMLNNLQKSGSYAFFSILFALSCEPATGNEVFDCPKVTVKFRPTK
jgi:hypothetical protein